MIPACWIVINCINPDKYTHVHLTLGLFKLLCPSIMSVWMYVYFYVSYDIYLAERSTCLCILRYVVDYLTLECNGREGGENEFIQEGVKDSAYIPQITLSFCLSYSNMYSSIFFLF